ncbi:hypothetical protein POM88_026540 [Heracleum sosnowskyi]|uniref:Uncharacterized protein n=1 Tax=Heracleum sosnowskyi TaxID=360622 RepID=A0AAD8I7A0_9APIA|nr:hypothetical protein POM88_026540 [Heracleum sosnowskyi]
MHEQQPMEEHEPYYPEPIEHHILDDNMEEANPLSTEQEAALERLKAEKAERDARQSEKETHQAIQRSEKLKRFKMYNEIRKKKMIYLAQKHGKEWEVAYNTFCGVEDGLEVNDNAEVEVIIQDIRGANQEGDTYFTALRYSIIYLKARVKENGAWNILFSFMDKVMIENIKDHLKYTEIGGVYTWEEKSCVWKLLKTDADFFELVNACKHGGEIALYVDNVVDKTMEPMWPGVPFVVQRPRKNIVAAGNTETVKRAFVSSHQLQQQRNYKKIARSPQMQELRPEPVNTRPEPVNTRPEPVNTRGMTKRKLDLSKNTNVEQPMNPYELARLNRVQQNKEKFNELGLGKYASNPSQPSVEESKTKNKNGEEDDEYVPIEDEIETEDERIKSIKERISKPGPRTRSRANATDLGDKDMRNAIEKEGKQVDTAKILKPTCSKLLKAADNSVPSGSVAAYIALRERQKQNLEADPMIENDVGESSLQPADEVVEAGPKKRRGRSKMLKVHARTVNEKVVIKVNKKGQPIGDRKLKAERTKEVDAGIYFAKYWSDGEVQSFAEDNKARRNSYVETHTLGPKSYAEVKNKLKNKDPNHASPSDARMYLKSRGN